MEIQKEVELVENYAIELRRYLHQIPEIGLEEYETSKKIEKELESLHISYRKAAGTGWIAEIGSQGPVIALRADMDALRITEENEVPYKSKKKGMMHACGHDVHMSCLLGAAKVLKKYETSLKFRVRLLFQPGEEGVWGADLMCKDGCLEEVEQVFGFHVFTDFACGLVSFDDGPRMSKPEFFTINIEGISGHAGLPHKCIDATVVAAAILMNLQPIISRNTDPIDSSVVTVGSLRSGTAANIVSGQAVMKGTIRSFSEQESSRIKDSLKRVVEYTAMAYDAKAKIEFTLGSVPPVINNPQVTALARKAMERILPKESIVSRPKIMLGEDFAVYMSKVPGTFGFVGAGNRILDCEYPNHHCRFNVDERVIAMGISIYLAFVLEYGIENKLYSE